MGNLIEHQCQPGPAPAAPGSYPAPKNHQPPHQQVDDEPGGGRGRVHGVEEGTFQEVPAHAVVGFQLDDARLHRLAALEQPFVRLAYTL